MQLVARANSRSSSPMASTAMSAYTPCHSAALPNKSMVATREAMHEVHLAGGAR